MRRAGVSSFGISGTNAHVVIEEAPREVAVAAEDAAGAGRGGGLQGAALGSVPLVVSGRDEAALRSQAGRWSEWLGSHPQADLAAVDPHGGGQPDALRCARCDQADDIGQAQEALEALAQGRAHPAVSTGTARLLGGVVFVFPGQGSQWPGMGRALLAESAVFADAIAACDAALLPHTGLVGARRAGRGRRRGGASARSGRRGAACAVCDGDRAGGGVAQSRGATGCSDRAQPG